MNNKIHDISTSSFTPLNVYEYLKRYGVRRIYEDEVFDLCLWLVSYINYKMMYFKETSVPIPTSFLIKFCGSRYDKLVIDILLEHGILKRTVEANKSLHLCNEYILTDNFLPIGKNYIRARGYRSQTFFRRLNRNLRKKEVENKLNKNLEKDMLYKILKNNITFDCESALYYIESRYGLDSYDYSIRRNFITYIQENNILAKYGNNCNRFYSTYTQMPSDLRPFIIIDGIITDKVYFDISNCHFQLLVHDILRKNISFSDNKDSQLFFNMIIDSENDFYSEMVKLFDVDISRDTMKTIFSIILYSNCQYSPDTKVHNKISVELIKDINKKFQKLFPTIATFLKNSTKKTGTKKAQEMRSDFALL